MQWTSILTPLDGSPVADAALPYAVALARVSGASVHLFAVVERQPRGLTERSEQVAAQIEQARRQALAEHLAVASAWVREQHVSVTAEIVVGEPVDEILTAAEREGVSAVAIATHGRSGLDRAAMGSVADKLIRLLRRPVLVIRPPYYPPPLRPVSLQRVMVPLDGSELAEAVLPLAADLAGAAGARLTLVRVEPWHTEGLAPPGTVPEFTRQEEEAAAEVRAYLDGVRARLPQELPVEVVVLRGRPADTLIEYARYERIDLTVMSTHGRSGLGRLLLGSVADRVIRGGVPVLLVRPQPRPAERAAPSAMAAVPGTRARDIMTAPVIAVREDTSLEDVARLMLRHNIGAVPVIDGQGTLRGIITEADFAEKERGVPFSAYRAPQLFGRWVSQRDVEAIYAAARSLPARAIMSTPVLTVTEDTPVKEILDLMLRHDVTHLPVVREGAPVGMVSRHDLLRLVARAAGEETAGATGG